MKIQTQFHLLITGIIIVPILSILSQMLFFNFRERKEQAEIPVYDGIMLGEYISRQEWEAISRFIARSNADFAVFRDDLLVLYSTIPDFKTGAYGTKDELFSLLAAETGQYGYTFESPGWLEGHEYILIRRHLQDKEDKGRPPRPLFPLASTILLPAALVIFAISMSLFIARSITRSVLVLEDAARRIAAGDQDLTVDVRGNAAMRPNEITSLTSSLNQMRSALKEEENRRYRFIMGVTHDLKTPLALIRGYTEALKDGVTDDPASRVNATDIIISKADQLEGMINDLLEFVRMDTGEWRSRLQKIDIDKFLKSFAKRISLDAELFHHHTIIDIALPPALYVPLDERLTVRALENLVNNAIRYTPNGTTIRLGAAVVENAIRITVSDNGSGINKTDLPHVFEMFYRGSSSRREEGMGLGLSIVKWVVVSHGWSIAVTSEPGGDHNASEITCFTITIPLSE
ncbi:MAG: HAMP domain-containing histidine kinase [Spirochaetaceae bacterium]|jgi:signal transduction histidine kinase|nr:HAMP domain-containing histidine kinase [Spirochaetaceae bacterium]